MRLSRVQWTIVAIIAASVLIVGWPTLYRYDRLKRGPFEFPVRINRVTGDTQCFNGADWVRSC